MNYLFPGNSQYLFTIPWNNGKVYRYAFANIRRAGRLFLLRYYQCKMKKKIHSKASIPLQVSTLTPEEEQELDFYVCCCIEEIENTLLKNPSEKQKKMGEISLKILRNPSEMHVKKKQVMRQWYGDYKSKFELKKQQVMASLSENKFVIKKAKISGDSVCYRKHALKNMNAVYDSKGTENSLNNEIDGNSISNSSFKFEF